MANYETLPGAISNGDLSTSQFRVVTLSGSTSVNFEVQGTTATTQIPIGVLQNDPSSSGDAAEVAISGVCKVRYGGTVAQGNLLTVTATGSAQASSTDAEQYIFGRALQNGTSTGIYYALVHAAYLYTT